MTNPTTEISNSAITSPYIELFKLDCSGIGGSTYYFSPHSQANGTGWSFGGQVYTPMPITSSGWQLNADGSQSRPTLTLALVNNSAILTAVKSLGDIVGAKVTRYRTFQKYLDGQSNADSSVYFNPDIYLVEQKTTHTNEIITWTLSSVIDKFGLLLPRRQLLRDGDSRNSGFPGISRYRGPR